MGFLSGLAKRPFVMILLLVIILIPVIFLLWMGAAYNGLVSRREGAIAQCVEVENQLDRKLTLIPQLLAITVQVNSFEANVLINITRLRSQWLNATTIDQRFNYSQQLDQTILGVRVNNENYPTLNSIWINQDLFTAVEGTENRITYAQGQYILKARDYNVKIQQFPDNLVAGWFGFQRIDDRCGL